MTRPRIVLRFAFLLLLCLPVLAAFSETIELVTYYPAPGNTGDQHARSLTVGTAYNGVTPNDGEAFIQSLLSVGSTAPADIAGGWGAPQRTKLWLQDNTAGAFPALVIAGTPTAAGGGGGAVQFVDATTNIPVGDFGVSGVGAASAASEVGIAARQNSTSISFNTTPALLPVLRMVINPNGNVGIGTPNPAGLLHLVGANDATSNVLFMPGADNPGVAGVPDIQVGIGADPPTTRLDVNGQIRMRGGNPGANKMLFSDATGLASWGWPSGSVIQMAWADGGSSSKGAASTDTNIYPTFAAAGTATISITPRSNNSQLLVEATFFGGIAVSPIGPPPIEANTTGYFRLYETTGTPAARGQGPSELAAVLHSYGAGAFAPSSIRALVDNGVTTQRTFRLYYSYKCYLDLARVNVTSNNIVYTVTEIQN